MSSPENGWIKDIFAIAGEGDAMKRITLANDFCSSIMDAMVYWKLRATHRTAHLICGFAAGVAFSLAVFFIMG